MPKRDDWEPEFTATAMISKDLADALMKSETLRRRFEADLWRELIERTSAQLDAIMMGDDRDHK